jgi:hypothetical protein
VARSIAVGLFKTGRGAVTPSQLQVRATLTSRHTARTGRRRTRRCPNVKGADWCDTATGTRSKELFTVDAGASQFRVRKIYGLDANSLLLRKMTGEELAVIAARHGPTRFEVTADGQISTVRHLGWFGKRYRITTLSGELTATVRDFSRSSYELTGYQTVRAFVSRQFARQQDLTIEIADTEDVVPMLAIVLALEALRDDRRQNPGEHPPPPAAARLAN